MSESKEIKSIQIIVQGEEAPDMKICILPYEELYESDLSLLFNLSYELDRTASKEFLKNRGSDPHEAKLLAGQAPLRGVNQSSIGALDGFLNNRYERWQQFLSFIEQGRNGSTQLKITRGKWADYIWSYPFDNLNKEELNIVKVYYINCWQEKKVS